VEEEEEEEGGGGPMGDVILSSTNPSESSVRVISCVGRGSGERCQEA
jgi:hypothetical protein